MIKTILSMEAALLVLCSGFLASCSDKDNETPGGGNVPPAQSAPTVTIATGNATANSLTFTLTLQDADKCTYLCTPEADPAPTAAQILAGGQSVTASGSITINELTPSTAYLLSAVASKGDVNSKIETLKHTTAAPDVHPAVVLTAGAATENSLTFTAVLTDSENAAFVCIEKTDNAIVPTAAQILADGTAITQAENTVGELLAEKTYIIAAAASNGAILSEVTQIEMTTQAAVGGPIALTRQEMGGYYGIPTGSRYGQYQLVLSDGETIEAGGVYATKGKGRALSLDLYQMAPSNLDAISLPARTYNYATSKGMSTFHPDKTYCMVNDGTDKLTKVEFQAGKIAVTKSGTNFTVTATLTTIDGEEFSATYTGPLTIENQTGGPAKLPDLTQDVTQIAFTRALAKYYEDTETADNCVVHLYDVEPGGLEYGSDYLNSAGHMVALDLSTAISEQMQLQEGTYNVSTTGTPGSYVAGYQDAFMDTVLALGTYCEKRNDQQESVYGFIATGTVTVTKSGSNYRFVLDFTTDKNHKVTGTYEGPVEMTDKR